MRPVGTFYQSPGRQGALRILNVHQAGIFHPGAPHQLLNWCIISRSLLMERASFSTSMALRSAPRKPWQRVISPTLAPMATSAPALNVGFYPFDGGVDEAAIYGLCSHTRANPRALSTRHQFDPSSIANNRAILPDCSRPPRLVTAGTSVTFSCHRQWHSRPALSMAPRRQPKSAGATNYSFTFTSHFPVG